MAHRNICHSVRFDRAMEDIFIHLHPPLGVKVRNTAGNGEEGRSDEQALQVRTYQQCVGKPIQLLPLNVISTTCWFKVMDQVHRQAQ